MEMQGIIKAVLEERGGIAKNSGNPWKVAQYLLETEEAYPKRMVFEVFGEDKINAMAIHEGEKMTVHFDIDSREYNGRWYNQIRAWKVERVGDAQSIAPATQQQSTPVADFNPFGEEEPPF